MSAATVLGPDLVCPYLHIVVLFSILKFPFLPDSDTDCWHVAKPQTSLKDSNVGCALKLQNAAKSALFVMVTHATSGRLWVAAQCSRDIHCGVMKFLASLERSGELIAVKCLQSGLRFCAVNSCPFFVCCDSFHSVRPIDCFSLFSDPAPPQPPPPHSSVIRSNTALRFGLAQLPCVLFQSRLPISREREIERERERERHAFRCFYGPYFMTHE